MWSIMVALPTIQADFGVSRANASLPFTMVMFGFAGGGVLMGRLADRFGIAVPLALGTLAVSAGYLATGWSSSLWQVALAHLLIGIGCSASFGPLMADISHWFVRRRGIAVSLAAVGNYVAGTIWPPVLQHFIATSGWRATHIARRLVLPGDDDAAGALHAPAHRGSSRRRDRSGRGGTAGQHAGFADDLAGPAVHRRSLLLRGDVDAAGAHRRLLRRPRLWRRARRRDAVHDARLRHHQPRWLRIHRRSHWRRTRPCCSARCCREPRSFSISGSTGSFLFTLFRRCSGCSRVASCRATPSSCANIFRRAKPARASVIVLMATLLGMALGGWLSGLIFDLTGSYRAAFFNGLAWNLVNVSIMAWLLQRSRRRGQLAAA